MPRVKSRDEFAWTVLAGRRVQRAAWKFVKPGYVSSRKFIFFEDTQQGAHATDVAEVVRVYRAHHEAHKQGICTCRSTLEQVESVAPLDGRTQLICEEVL